MNQAGFVRNEHIHKGGDGGVRPQRGEKVPHHRHSPLRPHLADPVGPCGRIEAVADQWDQDEEAHDVVPLVDRGDHPRADEDPGWEQ